MIKKMPKVTVLVPSYNHGHYINQRIMSILNQTYRNFDLIVIDDFSVDDSHKIISRLQSEFGFKYFRNKKNSGSPFTSWEQICEMATGDYIWICESDDVADKRFLETAIERFSAFPKAVMFYCNSNVIDENDVRIGHTDEYFHETWKETRWDKDFTADGIKELADFQLRGQTVPNMSSALFSTKAFRSAFTSFVKRLHLTGDWLFVGNVIKQGEVIFCHEALNGFRKHQITSRVRVKSARSQAEYLLTKFHLFKNSNKSTSEFAPLMKLDVIRFLYEPAKWYEVIVSLLQISIIDTIRLAFLLIISTSLNPTYVRKFAERFKHARNWSKNEQNN